MAIQLAIVSEEHIKKYALNRGEKITRTQLVFGISNTASNISIELPSDGHPTGYHIGVASS